MVLLFCSARTCYGSDSYVTKDEFYQFRDEVEFGSPHENISQKVHMALVDQGVPQQIAQTNTEIKAVKGELNEIKEWVQGYGDKLFEILKELVDQNADNSSLLKRIDERQDDLEQAETGRDKQITDNEIKINGLDQRVSIIEGKRKTNRDHWAVGVREVIVLVASSIMLWWLGTACKKHKVFFKILRKILRRKHKKMRCENESE